MGKTSNLDQVRAILPDFGPFDEAAIREIADYACEGLTDGDEEVASDALATALLILSVSSESQRREALENANEILNEIELNLSQFFR